MKKTWIIIIGVFFLSASAEAAVYYVRQGSPGGCTTTNPGACTWANAYPQLPATLERGATYYIAGSSTAYPSYTFTTGESTTTITTRIMIKKASPLEHGTDTGWSASYGTTQAIFSSFFNISRGYVTVDGQYRDETNWFDGAKYGFKIQNTGNWQHMRIMDPAGSRAVSSVTVKYIYIAAVVGSLPSTCENHCTQNYGPCAINTNTENQNIYNTDYLFSHLYIEGSNNPYFMRYLDDPTVEYSASDKTSGSSCWHGETVNLYYSNRGSGVVKFNHFRDQYNGTGGGPQSATGVIVFSESTGGQVFGNIIERFNAGNGAIAADWPNSNLKIHHNTFVDGSPYSDRPVIAFPNGGNTGTGNEAYNNLRVNTVQINFVSGAGTGGNNSTETRDVLKTDISLGLTRASNIRGRDLPSPFNKDRNEITRGLADGFLDTGALEFGGTVVPPSVFHPADTDEDSAISQNEVTLFGNCWKNQCRAEATVDNASRAGTLYIGSANGQYKYVAGVSCPQCWTGVTP